MQQIIPFVCQVNANTILAVRYCADFAIAQLIELDESGTLVYYNVVAK